MTSSRVFSAIGTQIAQNAYTVLVLSRNDLSVAQEKVVPFGSEHELATMLAGLPSEDLVVLEIGNPGQTTDIKDLEAAMADIGAPPLPIKVPPGTTVYPVDAAGIIGIPKTPVGQAYVSTATPGTTHPPSIELTGHLTYDSINVSSIGGSFTFAPDEEIPY